MPSPLRSCLLAGLLLGALLSTTAAVADSGSPQPIRPGDGGYGAGAQPLPDRGERPSYTIVSTPDFLNADVGDVSTRRSWDGVSNSINDQYVAALDVVLDQLAAERPDAVLVAGDMVEGHWGVDVDDTGIFGPVRTEAQARQAVRRAGRFYLGAWRQRFVDHGLPVPHVAVGDHEIGDNPWRVGQFKHDAMGTFKRTVARTLIGDRYPRSHRPTGTSFGGTSYWTKLGPDVMLVSVDVFRRRSSNVGAAGGVETDLQGAHLRWFRRTLAYGRRHFPWVVVQGHTPGLGPVRTAGSSSLSLEGGSRSRMWRAMTAAGVDLYLAGEVHQVTAIARPGQPVQVSHGGLFAFGGTRYVRIDVFDDRLELASYGLDNAVDRSGPRLWQTGDKRGVPADLTYLPGRRLRGTAVLTDDGRLVMRSGDLAPAAELGLQH